MRAKIEGFTVRYDARPTVIGPRACERGCRPTEHGCRTAGLQRQQAQGQGTKQGYRGYTGLQARQGVHGLQILQSL